MNEAADINLRFFHIEAFVTSMGLFKKKSETTPKKPLESVSQKVEPKEAVNMGYQSEHGSPTNGETQQAIAMQTFRTNVSAYRNSSGGYNRMAPGFDYVNWMPYGHRRGLRQSDTAFAASCRALAPYVHTAVVSGCIGRDEKLWAGSEPPGTPGRLAGSRGGSRAGSRGSLNARY